jgi:hypothetical protein
MLDNNKKIRLIAPILNNVVKKFSSWRIFMKNLALTVLFCLSLAPLPSQAQKATEYPFPSCKGSGLNIECPHKVYGTMSRQSGTLVCSYDKRLRVWQLMQGQKPQAKSVFNGVAQAPAAASSGREVLFQSESQSECETTGEALASKLSGSGFKWDTKTTEIKN